MLGETGFLKIFRQRLSGHGHQVSLLPLYGIESVPGTLSSLCRVQFPSSKYGRREPHETRRSYVYRLAWFWQIIKKKKLPLVMSRLLPLSFPRDSIRRMIPPKSKVDLLRYSIQNNGGVMNEICWIWRRNISPMEGGWGRCFAHFFRDVNTTIKGVNTLRESCNTSLTTNLAR